jgi:hypothetical protein
VLAARRESPLIMRPIVVELAVGDKDPGTATVFVTGGITSTPDDYRHEITGPDVEKVTVDAKTVTGGRQYVVTVPPKTAGTYVLIVRDLIGTTGVSRINVRKAE